MSRRLLALALAGLVVVVSVGAAPLGAQAQAPATQLSVPYQEFTLPNGLHVILHRDTACRWSP